MRADAFSRGLAPLDAMTAPRKMRPSILYRSSLSNVPEPRSHRDAVARDHRDHHYRSSEEGTAERLDAGLASVAAGTAAAGWRSVHAALRARARRPRHPRIVVVADIDP